MDSSGYCDALLQGASKKELSRIEALETDVTGLKLGLKQKSDVSQVARINKNLAESKERVEQVYWIVQRKEHDFMKQSTDVNSRFFSLDSRVDSLKRTVADLSQKQISDNTQIYRVIKHIMDSLQKIEDKLEKGKQAKRQDKNQHDHERKKPDIPQAAEQPLYNMPDS
jgi:hypothetical protein